MTPALRLYLRRDLRLGVGDLDAQLLRAADDVDPLPRGDGVGNPATELAIRPWVYHDPCNSRLYSGGKRTRRRGSGCASGGARRR